MDEVFIIIMGAVPLKTRLIPHVLFPRLLSAAERLRKKWEEEEEERMKQMLEPVEPKSRRTFTGLCKPRTGQVCSPKQICLQWCLW